MLSVVKVCLPFSGVFHGFYSRFCLVVFESAMLSLSLIVIFGPMIALSFLFGGP